MILVTGGTGMVGMHLLLALTLEEKEVRATYRSEDTIDRVEEFFAFAKAQSQLSLIQWIAADITDIPSLEIAFQGVTYVYHCAGFISFDPYDFSKLKKVNIEGTANVVNMCLTHGVKKLCHVSSIATLAKTPHKPINEENHWNPDTENSVYAISKYGGEMEVWRGSQEGLSTVIINPGIILGEGDYSVSSGKMFTQVAKGLPFYTSGTSGIIDVKSVVRMLLLVMEAPIEKERFILVSHNISYKQLLTSIAQVLDVKPPRKQIPAILLYMYVIVDSVKGWFIGKRMLTKVAVKSLQGISSYDNTAAITKLGMEIIPLSTTLDRIKNHFLYTKGIKTL